jgi:hypothetical protein
MPSSAVAEMAQKIQDEELFYFEGSEKKMEIDFVPVDGSDPADIPSRTGMRSYRRQFWADCIALLNGSILLHEDQVQHAQPCIHHTRIKPPSSLSHTAPPACGVAHRIPTRPAHISVVSRRCSSPTTPNRRALPLLYQNPAHIKQRFPSPPLRCPPFPPCPNRNPPPSY